MAVGWGKSGILWDAGVDSLSFYTGTSRRARCGLHTPVRGTQHTVNYGVGLGSRRCHGCGMGDKAGFCGTRVWTHFLFIRAQAGGRSAGFTRLCVECSMQLTTAWAWEPLLPRLWDGGLSGILWDAGVGLLPFYYTGTGRRARETCCGLTCLCVERSIQLTTAWAWDRCHRGCRMGDKAGCYSEIARSLPFCWEAMGCGLHLLGRRESARRRFPAIFPDCCPVLHCCHALTGEPPCLEYTVFYKGNSTGAAHRQGKPARIARPPPEKISQLWRHLEPSPCHRWGCPHALPARGPPAIRAPTRLCLRRLLLAPGGQFPMCAHAFLLRIRAQAAPMQATAMPSQCPPYHAQAFCPNLPGATCTATFGCMFCLSLPMQGGRPPFAPRAAAVPAPSAASCARRGGSCVVHAHVSGCACTGGADAGHCHAVLVPALPCTSILSQPAWGNMYLPPLGACFVCPCPCRRPPRHLRPRARLCLRHLLLPAPGGASLRGPCPCLRVRVPGRRRCRPPSCRPGARPLSPPLPRATVLHSACPGQAPGAPSARPPARPPRPPWRRPNP